jgi:xanthine dehydrogenase accessory factor
MTPGPLPDDALVLIRGGGDLGSGAATAIHREGLRVAVLERPDPWCVRQATCVARAVADGEVVVDGVRARRALRRDLDTWDWRGAIAVLVAPRLADLGDLDVAVLVDARVLKHGHDTRVDDAPRVIGVGPGFTVGRHCHAAVETLRGDELGRVVLVGSTRPFTGEPGDVEGETTRRVLRAPRGGLFTPTVALAHQVTAGQVVGLVDGAPVMARCSGVVRGLLPQGSVVRTHQKVGDVDPRGDPAACWVLSDKAVAVGRGVVQALRVIAR